MIEVLEDPALKKIATIQHGFFTRQGGVSTGIHASLNCAYPSHDDSEAVQENLRRALAHLGHPLSSLATVRNVHGNTAVIIDQVSPDAPKLLADAMVTKQPQLILGSDSADCPIVLFAAEEAKVIGLAHAGWKGAKSGILEATLDKMKILGAKPQQITAAISPCIAQNSYEVSFDFYQQFLDEDSANQQYFKDAQQARHYFFDLLAYVKNRLQQLGLKSVSAEVALDTYSDEKRFFSYRRARHRNEPYFGGHLSCIFMKA